MSNVYIVTTGSRPLETEREIVAVFSKREDAEDFCPSNVDSRYYRIETHDIDENRRDKIRCRYAAVILLHTGWTEALGTWWGLAERKITCYITPSALGSSRAYAYSYISFEHAFEALREYRAKWLKESGLTAQKGVTP